jgi:putative DNA primase/helicase
LNQALPQQFEADQRQEVLRQFFAYTLLDDARLETMLVLLGDGGNGKSVILRVLEAMVGERNVSHIRPSDINRPGNLQQLSRKLLNTVHEWGTFRNREEKVLKQVVSGSPMQASRPHQESEAVTPRAKIALATNWLPEFHDTSDGMWRRLLIIPFDHYFDEAPDTSLADKIISKELDGVVSWALPTLPSLLQSGKFADCARCLETWVTHRRECDTVESFLTECTEAREGSSISKQELCTLYKYYVRICLERHPLSDIKFFQEMKKRKIPVVRAYDARYKHRVWWYGGIVCSERGVAMEEARIGMQGA